MIAIKTTEQIEAMREGWQILKKIHEEIWKMITPGISTMDLEKKAEELFKKYKAIPSFKWYKWFPCILCTSINEVVVHWIPSENDILQNWDVISIDCWCYFKKMHTDSCHTYLVWEVDYQIENLSNTVKKAMNKWIKKIRHWARLWDIEGTVQKVLEQNWYCPIYDCTGHWVWSKLHEEPEILNYWKKGTWPILKAWMVLAIEPSATLWHEDCTSNLNWDWWTLVAKDKAICCQWEHTVLVTKDWYEILT